MSLNQNSHCAYFILTCTSYFITTTLPGSSKKKKEKPCRATLHRYSDSECLVFARSQTTAASSILVPAPATCSSRKGRPSRCEGWLRSPCFGQAKWSSLGRYRESSSAVCKTSNSPY